MNNRIRTLRKSLRMTQEEFGEQLGVTKLTVLRWERDNKVPEPSLRLICRIFQVNKRWLETGEGEMIIDRQSSAHVDGSAFVSPYAYAVQHGFTVEFASLFARLCELSPEDKRSIGSLVSRVFSKTQSPL